MSWLFEDSLLVTVVALGFAIFLGYAWIQTRRRAFLFGSIACIVLSILAAIIERSVTTDREAVERVLSAAAQTVERNNLEELLTYIHPQAPEIRARATAEFPRYQFTSVRIKSNMQIEIDSSATPPEATASFNVVVSGQLRDHPLHDQQVPRFAVVRFRKHDQDWRVIDYEHHEPTMGFKQQSRPRPDRR